ncbi:MAG: hypothetical protein DRO23_08265 [Thermoprotei archaeon]|nr:MAG: hypothetical protein DRO23_08265 [Thermoprotei archaeon]
MLNANIGFRWIMEEENIILGHNDEMFYVKVGKRRVTRLLYKIEDNVMYLTSIYTLKEFRGRGLASKIVEYALNYALEKGIKELKISCNYVKHWLQKHPNYAEKFRKIIYDQCT